ncbi:hypothetical protein IG631_00244 [Alternaria alternata]|nr:hypothetical protein IG631_00244 [Alternaria alternata]
MAVRRVSRCEAVAPWVRSYQTRLHRIPWGYPPSRWAFPARHQPQCSATVPAPVSTQNLLMCTGRSTGRCWECPAALVDMVEEVAHSNIGFSQCSPGGHLQQGARSS